MDDFDVRPLDETTWPAFAELVEDNGGVWGGCWCMSFHSEGTGRDKSPAQNRVAKQTRVREGRAHAVLVFDGPACLGWCQFGAPDELPRIKNRSAYAKGLTDAPDWRITCFFVGKKFRHRGVAAVALEGTLDEIARLGGGTVESYPEDPAGRSVSSSFLHTGTVSLFERHGFERSRRIGKHRWVVTKLVRAAAGTSA